MLEFDISSLTQNRYFKDFVNLIKIYFSIRKEIREQLHRKSKNY